jgi:glutamyl-tRNA synthetase/glutamyl-Q tRNA(Asp) synthetase
MTTRFAPSLTGYLHLGHVLHMVYVWGVARHRNAKVVCRIEDHDRGRARMEYETSILETLDWLGFVPDEGITLATADKPSKYRQSDCDNEYEKMLQLLNMQGLVYGCECTRRQIVDEQAEEMTELCYSGTCREKGLSLEGNTVRFRIPDDEVVFEDGRLGTCCQTPKQQCGDFSLRDRQGQWTYQFACVCDDIRQGVDLVVRGEDILSSTGRQILLLRALESSDPEYFHHALLRDSRGEKLSKRQRSESIAQLRDIGIAPEEVIGRAVHAGGFTGEEQSMTAAEAMVLVK